MSLPVSWLLEQTEISGFSLLAGDAAHCPDITGINFIDNPSTTPWLTPGSLVLSTGYLIANRELPEDLIPELHKKQCSALGIKMNRYLKELPPKMIQQANELHFPVISLPFTCNMTQISSLIYRNLYEAELNEAQKYALLYRNISDCIFKNQSVSRLMNIISTSVDASAFLLNDTFEIIEYHILKTDPLAFPYPFSRDACTLFSETDIQYLLGQYLSRPLPFFTHEILTNGTRLVFQLFPVNSRKRLLGWLILLNASLETDGNLFEFVCGLQSMLGLCLLNQSMRLDMERSTRDDFFQQLLSGSCKSVQELDTLCARNRFPAYGKRICAVIRSDTYEKLTISKRRFAERRMREIFQHVLEPSGLKFLHTVYQTCFVLFVFFEGNQLPRENAELVRSYIRQILNEMEAINFPAQAGVSKISQGPASILQNHHQALQALNTGALIHAGDNCYSYLEDEIFHDLMTHYTHQQLTEIYDEYLGILKQYDQENHSELLKTLRTWLNCKCSAAQAAKELYIHRNTMFYRLDQIRTLLGMDLTDERDLYRLRTAFYIQKIL